MPFDWIMINPVRIKLIFANTFYFIHTFFLTVSLQEVLRAILCSEWLHLGMMWDPMRLFALQVLMFPLILKFIFNTIFAHVIFWGLMLIMRLSSSPTCSGSWWTCMTVAHSSEFLCQGYQCHDAHLGVLVTRAAVRPQPISFQRAGKYPPSVPWPCWCQSGKVMGG